MLIKFGTKYENINFLHNPNFQEWVKLIQELRKNYKANPDKLILNMHCYAGHGMSFEGRQVLLINEYSSVTKFYKTAAVEIEIRNLSKF